MKRLELLAPHLPFLRRYARALTGDRPMGDGLVRDCLEALQQGELGLDGALEPRVALYRAFDTTWRTLSPSIETPSPIGGADTRSTAADRLMRIAPRSRRAFLLTAVEGFTDEEAAAILSTTQSDIEALIVEAQADIDAELATSVLIIEDEPIIAADLYSLVLELGHQVTDIASTRDAATVAAHQHPPGLILADIKLADGSSGIDASLDILKEIDVPVIFITGIPERLLTGKEFEPALIVTKPFDPMSLKAMIGQVLFFSPRRGEPATRRSL